MFICPEAFTTGSPTFPKTIEERATAYYNLEFPQNHCDHYAKSLVGTFQHEIHHALFQQSEFTIFYSLAI